MTHLVVVQAAVRVNIRSVVLESHAAKISPSQPGRFGRVGQIHVHERGRQDIHRVILPAKVRIEEAGGQVGSLKVGEIPDSLTQEGIGVGSAFEPR